MNETGLDETIEMPAWVVALDGEFAWVQTRPVQACPNCDPVHGCRSLSIARIFSPSANRFRVKNPHHAQLGETVWVQISANMLRKTAIFAYLLPFLGLMFGAVIGAFWDEWASIFGAILGLGLALLGLKFGKLGIEIPMIAQKSMQTIPTQSGCASK